MPKPPADLYVQLAEARQRAPRADYPPALRRLALAWARARAKEGHAQGAIAKALGLPASTLSRWTSGEHPPAETALVDTPISPGTTTNFRPVQLVHAPSAAVVIPLVLHTPAGYRVEGLDLDGLTQLLTRLG